MTPTEVATKRNEMIDSHIAYTNFILDLSTPVERPGIDTVHTTDASVLTIPKPTLMTFYRQVARHFYDHGYEDATNAHTQRRVTYEMRPLSA